jgi:flagellar biosynthesis protein FlgN
MDPNLCREHLGVLFSEEIDVLGQLEELLQSERDALNANDIEALEATALARQQRVGELTRIEEQRRSLCRLHGNSADLAGLERIVAWCDPAGSLVSRLRDCGQRAARCRDLNDRNGALVKTHLKRVEGILGVITGSSGQPVTYDATGSAGGQRAGRILGAA